MYPENITEFTVKGLSLDTRYQFNVIGINSKGLSDPSTDVVEATTKSE